MNLTKREFMQVIGAASVAGLHLHAYAQTDAMVSTTFRNSAKSLFYI
jgi:hypothetical protein